MTQGSLFFNFDFLRVFKGKKKDNKNRIGDAIKGIGSAARKARDLADLKGTGGGDQEEGGLQGNTQRTKGVLS